MRKIVFFQDNSKSVGCDGCVLEEWPDDATDVQLSDYAMELAIEWVGSWFDVVDDDFTDDESEIGLGSVDGWWEPYDPAKHDMLLT